MEKEAGSSTVAPFTETELLDWPIWAPEFTFAVDSEVDDHVLTRDNTLHIRTSLADDL